MGIGLEMYCEEESVFYMCKYQHIVVRDLENVIGTYFSVIIQGRIQRAKFEIICVKNFFTLNRNDGQ